MRGKEADSISECCSFNVVSVLCRRESSKNVGSHHALLGAIQEEKILFRDVQGLPKGIASP